MRLPICPYPLPEKREHRDIYSVQCIPPYASFGEDSPTDATAHGGAVSNGLHQKMPTSAEQQKAGLLSWLTLLILLLEK